MKCPKCQHENREGAKFCRNCGAELELVCPKCQHHNEPDSLFCDECGTGLAETTTIAPPKLEDMQRQLQDRIPQSLADKLFAGARDMPLDQYVETIDECFKILIASESGKECPDYWQ